MGAPRALLAGRRQQPADGAAAAGGAGAGDRRRSSAACSTAGLDQLAAGCTYHTGIPATVAAAAPA